MMAHSITITALMTLVLVTNSARSTPEVTQRTGSNAQTDFATSVQNQMNPRHQDYGRKLQAESAFVFQETLGSAYFWVTATSLGTSFLLLWFVTYLIQQRQRREIICAKFLAWYHNELVCVRQSLMKATSYSTPASDRSAQGKTEDQSTEVLAELSRLRQLVTSQEGTEKVLRTQINSLAKKLTEEKQRNKSLKVE